MEVKQIREWREGPWKSSLPTGGLLAGSLQIVPSHDWLLFLQQMLTQAVLWEVVSCLS